MKLHQRFAPPSFAIASFLGSTNVLAFEHHREVGSVSGEVMLSPQGDATSICPVTGQHSLFLSSAIRIAIDPPCGFTSPKGAIRTYPVQLRGHDRLDLPYTPTAWDAHGRGLISLGTHCNKSAEHLPLPANYDASGNLHMLVMLSTLAPGRLDASSCIITSRFRCRSFDRGIRCRWVP